MKNWKIWIAIILLILTNMLTYYIVTANFKPEKVIVTQEKEIIKYQYKLKEKEIQENERFLLRLPWPLPQWGISKDFTLGLGSGLLVGLL